LNHTINKYVHRGSKVTITITTLINVHATTEDKINEDKEQVCEDLQTVVDKVPKCDIVIILGHLNAKLGKEQIYSNLRGKHTLQEKINRMVKCYANLLLQII